MKNSPNKPNRGDAITANWARDVATGIAQNVATSGPGVRISRSPCGTVVSVAQRQVVRHTEPLIFEVRDYKAAGYPDRLMIFLPTGSLIGRAYELDDSLTAATGLTDWYILPVSTTGDIYVYARKLADDQPLKLNCQIGQATGKDVVAQMPVSKVVKHPSNFSHKQIAYGPLFIGGDGGLVDVDIYPAFSVREINGKKAILLPPFCVAEFDQLTIKSPVDSAEFDTKTHPYWHYVSPGWDVNLVVGYKYGYNGSTIARAVIGSADFLSPEEADKYVHIPIYKHSNNTQIHAGVVYAPQQLLTDNQYTTVVKSVEDDVKSIDNQGGVLTLQNFRGLSETFTIFDSSYIQRFAIGVRHQDYFTKELKWESAQAFFDSFVAKMKADGLLDGSGTTPPVDPPDTCTDPDAKYWQRGADHTLNYGQSIGDSSKDLAIHIDCETLVGYYWNAQHFQIHDTFRLFGQEVYIENGFVKAR